jgi:hypothetical protein
MDRLGDRYVALHGGSSFDLAGSPLTLPPEADGPGGTAVTTKFYEPRDNLLFDGRVLAAVVGSG